MRTFYCRDAGFDCEGIIRANSDDEVLQDASRHAQKVHGVRANPEMAAQLKMLIRDE